MSGHHDTPVACPGLKKENIPRNMVDGEWFLLGFTAVLNINEVYCLFASFSHPWLAASGETSKIWMEEAYAQMAITLRLE